MMSAFWDDWATLAVLWRRDMLRFWRQPSRLVGALGQPIIFWAVIGSGMAATFVLPDSGLDYREYFFPGVILMVGVFASIFAAVSVIDDRHQGFLQAVLAGPGSRASLVLGKCLGSASVALVQIGLFLLLAPLAGFRLERIAWPLLLVSLLLSTVALSALGFAVAWWIDNVQGYHAVQMTVLIPLWVVSGAMFPYAPKDRVFAWLMLGNPIAYGLCAVRAALYGGTAPPGTLLPVPMSLVYAVLVAFAGLSVVLATLASRRA